MALVRVDHTDFAEQQAFMALPLDDKLLRIFLNGNETNGKVADVIRDMEEVKRDLDEEIKPKVERHDRWLVGFAAVVTTAVLLGPLVFFVLGRIWE